MDHGTPTVSLRLIDKNFAYWGGDNPHDRLIMKDESPIKHLKGDILHYSYNSIEEHALQNNKFSTISAETYFKRGKRTSIFKMILHPFWAFFLGYILRGGFLDGFYGLVVAVHVAHLSFLKHAKLYLKQKKSVMMFPSIEDIWQGDVRHFHAPFHLLSNDGDITALLADPLPIKVPVIGITGPPGAGKSTLTNKLIGAICTGR